MLGRGSCVLDLMYKVKNDKGIYSTIYTRLFNKLHLNWKQREKKKALNQRRIHEEIHYLEHNTHTHMYVC